MAVGSPRESERKRGEERKARWQGYLRGVHERTQNISVSGNKRIFRNNYESTSVWVQAQVAQASPTRLQA
jgi:hypothetical protein